MSGNIMSCEEFILTHRPLLYRLVFARVGNHAQAEDIVQDICVKIHRFWESCRNPEAVLAWAISIIKYTIIDSTRSLKDKKRRNTAELQEGMDRVDGIMKQPIDVLINMETYQLLSEIISELSELDQELIRCKYLRINFDNSNKNIARTLGIKNAHAVANRLNYIKTRILSDPRCTFED